MATFAARGLMRVIFDGIDITDYVSEIQQDVPEPEFVDTTFSWDIVRTRVPIGPSGPVEYRITVFAEDCPISADAEPHVLRTKHTKNVERAGKYEYAIIVRVVSYKDVYTASNEAPKKLLHVQEMKVGNHV